MRHKIKTTLLFILPLVLFVLNTVTLMAETQVSISVSNNLAFIGDRILLKIIVKTTSDVDKITLKAREKDFEILDQAPTQKRRQQDYSVFEKSIEVAFFKVGEFNVGPFEIDLKKGESVIETRETNSVPVTVKTVLKEDDKDIKPLEDLIDIKGNPFYILKYVIIAVVIIVAVILIIWWFKKRRRTPVKEEPSLSPLEELEARVKALYGKDLFDKGKVKLFFIELTEIIKIFLNRTYGFNAEDFTTYETLYELKRCEKEVPITDNMEFLFNTADLVKFARFEPDIGVLGEISGKIANTVGIYKQRAAALEAQEQEQRKSRESRDQQEAVS